MKAIIIMDGDELKTDFFDNFNWHKFNYGEDVHIEDDCTNYILAYFVTNVVTKKTNHVYIRSVH